MDLNLVKMSDDHDDTVGSSLGSTTPENCDSIRILVNKAEEPEGSSLVLRDERTEVGYLAGPGVEINIGWFEFASYLLGNTRCISALAGKC